MDNLIEFAKEQCEIFPEDSAMGWYLRETLKMLQAEPCEDAISREDVIKAVDRHTFDTNDGLCLDEDITIVLEELPPVKPVRKKGKWIDIMIGDMPAQACDQCNTFYPLAYTGGGHKYCPNCGSFMMEGEEE